MSRRRSLGARFLVVGLLLLAPLGACAEGSGGTGTTGVGTFTVLTFTPNPVPGGVPVAFTITGVGFETLVGTTALVRFDAEGGATPFAGGTSATATVTGLVASDTTITGTTPAATVCGPASVTAVVTVTLESGVSDSSLGTFVVTFTAPTVTSVTGTVGNTVPALAPSPITVNGTGFGPVGGTVTLTFAGDSGAVCFADGTSNLVDVVGTITTSTTISATSPRCTNPIVGTGGAALSVALQGASVVVTLDDSGSCSAASATPGAIQFDRPDGQLSVGGATPQTIPQTLPTAFTIVTVPPVTNVFDPPGGGVVQVKFVATAGTPFEGGTSDTAVVAASLVSATTIAGTTPQAVATADFTASVRIVFEDGTVGDGAATTGTVTFSAPPVVTNVTTSQPVVGATPRTFLSLHPTQTTITGANFDPGATVLFYDNAQGPGTPLGLTGALSGTPFAISVLPGSITGTNPQNFGQTGPVQAAVRVTNPDGQVGTFTASDFRYLTIGHLGNVNASFQGNSNAEMGLGVDPTNPLRIAILCHDSTSNFLNITTSRSTDGGLTWTRQSIGAAQDGDATALRRVDPRCAFDRFGNFYVCYFSTGPGGVPRNMYVLQSADGGATFPIVSNLGTDPTSAMDREFLCTGPDGANLAQEAVYVGWRDGGTFSGGGDAIVVAGATSTGLGNLSAFSAPIPLTDTPAQFHQEAFGAVTADGDLHVVWVDYTADPGTGPELVMYDRDPQGLFAGAGFGTDLLLASSNVGFLEPIPGQPNRGIGVNPEVTAVRAGPFAGRVYVTYMDELPDNSDNVEVRSIFTDNDMLTMSAIGTVNDVALNAQFNASIVADRTTGTLFCTWYDTRLDPLAAQADLFGSASFDGGVTWELNLRLSDAASNATGLGGNDFLEYNGIDAVGGCCVSNWADNSNSTGDNPNGTGSTDSYTVRWQNGP